MIWLLIHELCDPVCSLCKDNNIYLDREVKIFVKIDKKKSEKVVSNVQIISGYIEIWCNVYM